MHVRGGRNSHFGTREIPEPSQATLSSFLSCRGCVCVLGVSVRLACEAGGGPDSHGHQVDLKIQDRVRLRSDRKTTMVALVANSSIPERLQTGDLTWR